MRRCELCSANISHRHPTAIFCERCADTRIAASRIRSESTRLRNRRINRSPDQPITEAEAAQILRKLGPLEDTRRVHKRELRDLLDGN